MELLLIKDVAEVGKKGDVIKVRDGFGRNFLIPKNLAILATRENREFFAEQRSRSAARKAKEKEEAERKAKELANLKITMEVKAGEGDKLYGSVGAEDIRQALAEKGYQIEKKQVRLREALKSLGAHQLDLEIYPQVKVRLTVELIRQP